MKTNKDYTVNFKDYGLITVPAGTSLTNQTSLGIDKSYHFVNDFAWIKNNYPKIDRLLLHDASIYGINIPVEYVDFETEKH